MREAGVWQASWKREQAFSFCVCVCTYTYCFDQAAYLLVCPHGIATAVEKLLACKNGFHCY